MKNKTKMWRRMAIVHNVVASVREGRRMYHQGRINKTQYTRANGVASTLISNMLIRSAEHGIFSLTFTKKQIDDMAKAVASNQPTSEDQPNETE